MVNQKTRDLCSTVYTTLNTKTQLAARDYQDKAFQADKKKILKKVFCKFTGK